MCLKKLYHDTTKKILYFQVVLRAQHSVYIGTLEYGKWTPRDNRPKCEDDDPKKILKKKEWHTKNVDDWKQSNGLVIKVKPV